MTEHSHLDISPDDPCAFCMGVNAVGEGLSRADNPFDPSTGDKFDKRIASDHFLWNAGYSSEAADPEQARRRAHD